MNCDPEIEVEAVLAGQSVVYWRYRPVGTDRWLGAISRRTANGAVARSGADTACWRAVGYDPVRQPPNGNRNLGQHPTHRAADRAVRDYIARVFAPADRSVTS
jgi:hypothetical protein